MFHKHLLVWNVLFFWPVFLSFARRHYYPIFFFILLKVINTMNAWFDLTAPLFTLDQYVQWTAPRDQGEGTNICRVQVDS